MRSRKDIQLLDADLKLTTRSYALLIKICDLLFVNYISVLFAEIQFICAFGTKANHFHFSR